MSCPDALSWDDVAATASPPPALRRLAGQPHYARAGRGRQCLALEACTVLDQPVAAGRPHLSRRAKQACGQAAQAGGRYVDAAPGCLQGSEPPSHNSGAKRGDAQRFQPLRTLCTALQTQGHKAEQEFWL